uniref:Proline rich and Gla domain 2 n=1 Tax=Cebus imitator TaxID=2715852 RepID=A0A2K5QD53_CEBIM
MRGHPSLLLLYMGFTTCLNTSPSGEKDQEVFLGPPEAQSFLSRHTRIRRANHWDLELFTPGNLERECLEEKCSWEEAREYFEDDTLTERFWESYIYNGKGVASANCTFAVPRAGLISPLSPLSPLGPPTPVPPPPPPGLPTYEQALAASGVHDAPPPPYSSLRRPH